jgi:5-(carboxyamino)imidazole ribonucleotide synthase
MILPPATLGMLGGGQLGRFFVAAAHEMGYKVWVLDPDPNSPAGLIADRHLQAAYDDYAALDVLAEGCAAVTTEFENVPADTLDYLAKFVPVRPGASAVAVCQNRIAEKSFLRDNGLPHGPFAVIHVDADIAAAPASLYPAILKVARFGYDGKGQARVANAAEALHAFHAFKGEPCVLEQMLTLDYEVSVVLARDERPRQVLPHRREPPHQRHPRRLHRAGAGLRLPARRRPGIRRAHRRTAGLHRHAGGRVLRQPRRAGGQRDGPRPHNSGHHTIDACVTSQYEQQVRALCGLPLGEARQHSASVMVNLLGELWYDGGEPHGRYREPDWSLLHAVPGLRLHLYAKHHARHGRKMGHFTVIGSDADDVLAKALAARQAIGIRGD